VRKIQTTNKLSEKSITFAIESGKVIDFSDKNTTIEYLVYGTSKLSSIDGADCGNLTWRCSSDQIHRNSYQIDRSYSPGYNTGDTQDAYQHHNASHRDRNSHHDYRRKYRNYLTCNNDISHSIYSYS
jgi:hypothetical protein